MSLPAAQFSLSGASGSQGLLGPRQGAPVYLFPRGAWASAASSGTLITFDSASVASRYSVNAWIQVGISPANVRKVSAVGGNSLSVSGSAITVAKNDRVFLIGSTQPTVSGGIATYITPNTVIRQRDDEGSDIISNSMVTSDSNGLIAFYATQGLYDCLIQDANRINQGFIADLTVGVAEGVSTTAPAVFGATVTINANAGITGSLILSGTLSVGQTTTLGAFVGVTGSMTVGGSVTITGAFGVTGTGTFGATLTANANFGVTGTAVFGQTVTLSGRLVGTTGQFSGGLTTGGKITATASDADIRRLQLRQGTLLVAGNFSMSPGWGNTASLQIIQDSYDCHGAFKVTAGGTGIGANPTVTINFVDGTFGNVRAVAMATTDTTTDDQVTVPWTVQPMSLGTTLVLTWRGTPVAGKNYGVEYLIVG